MRARLHYSDSKRHLSLFRTCGYVSRHMLHAPATLFRLWFSAPGTPFDILNSPISARIKRLVPFYDSMRLQFRVSCLLHSTLQLMSTTLFVLQCSSGSSSLSDLSSHSSFLRWSSGSCSCITLLVEVFQCSHSNWAIQNSIRMILLTANTRSPRATWSFVKIATATSAAVLC